MRAAVREASAAGVARPIRTAHHASSTVRSTGVMTMQGGGSNRHLDISSELAALATTSTTASSCTRAPNGKPATCNVTRAG